MLLPLLAATAFELAKPYLKKGAEAVAGEAAKDAYAKVKSLLGKKEENQTVLAQYEANPTDANKDAVLALLTKALEQSPHEARELQTIVTNYQNYSQVNKGVQSVGNNNVFIQGVDPEKHADVLVELKLTIKELEEKEKENVLLVKALQLSESERQRVLTENEQVRNKGNADIELNAKLKALDELGDYAAADKLLEAKDKEHDKESAKTKFQRAGYAKLQLKFKEALAFYEEAIRLDTENALYLNNAGSMMLDLGFYQRALVLFERAKEYALEQFGADSELLADIYNNTGIVWSRLGNIQKAIEFNKESLLITVGVFGERNKSVATRYNNLGMELCASGQYQQAIDLYIKAINIHRSTSGERTADVAAVYSNLGELYKQLEEYPEAAELHIKSLDINIYLFGERHTTVATNYNNLGEAWRKMGNYKKALEYYNKSLSIMIDLLGENHPYVATTYNNIGLALNNSGEHQQAIDILKKALKMDIITYGEKHPTISTRYNNLGFAYLGLKDYNKAAECMEMSLQLLEELYPDGQYQHIERVRENLAFIHSHIKS